MTGDRIRVDFEAVNGLADSMSAGSKERADCAVTTQRKREVLAELYAHDPAGDAIANGYGQKMTTAELHDSQVLEDLANAHRTLVENSAQCVQRAIARL
ncbi:hypothetical protein [Thermocrispum municipale]|jgi:hypothetical protein|uniref:hypothetical protein n=1 Tax=Thermocrispum municipale TaxID=37926 RepID=UPI0003F95B16|nr:hypothetical protein [Thermocrispum municipale]